MLRTLKDLFDHFAAPAQDQSPAAQAHAVQLASAVLLVEVMRADHAHSAAERASVLASLRKTFTLTESELALLLALAEQTAQTAYDYHRFTKLINERLSQPEKIAMVEALWHVAYADAHLDAHENQVISKIAGLLHVTHGDYIAAKLHAKQAAGKALKPA